jgi:hypothetical protein
VGDLGSDGAARLASTAGRGGRIAPPRTPTVARFTLRTLGWLPVAFAVWYVLAPVLLFPAVLLVRAVAALGLRDIVHGVEQARAVVTFVTTLRPGGGAANAVLTVDVNLLLYSFGLPFFAALAIAARDAAWKRHLAVGYAALLPCIAWGVLFDFLKNVAVTAGPAVLSQAGFAAWQREAIVFAFQFGSLILPAVAPAVLWVALHARFIGTLRTRQRYEAPAVR